MIIYSICFQLSGGQLKAQINNDKPIVNSINAALILKDEILPGEKSKISKTQKQKISQQIHPVVAIKSVVIKDEYNQLILEYKNHFTVVFRLYDEPWQVLPAISDVCCLMRHCKCSQTILPVTKREKSLWILLQACLLHGMKPFLWMEK